MASNTDRHLNDYTVYQACFCCVNSVYCKYPECLGCLVKSTVLFCDCFHSCGCYEIDTCCSSQQQCLCIDTRAAIPCTMAVPCACTLLPYCVCYPRLSCCVTIADIISEQDRDSDFNVDLHYVTICAACCCMISGSYCKIPECIGLASFHTCLCLRCESYLKPQCNHMTCLKIIGRCCFLDHRCAIPCEKEVPFACTLLPFCILIPCGKRGCCLSIADLSITNSSHRIITVNHTVTQNVIITHQPTSIPPFIQHQQEEEEIIYNPAHPPLATAVIVDEEPQTLTSGQGDDKTAPLLQRPEV